METTSLYISLFFLVISLSIIAIVIHSLWRLLFKKEHAPFIPIPQQAIPYLLEHATIGEHDMVYDLGCGDARILCALAKKNPQATFIGIEKALFPFFVAKIRSISFPNITIQRKNFFKVPLNNATVIITYLFPSVMDLLLPKLETELHNTKLFSFDFPFSKKEHETIYVLKERSGKLGSKIFVYRFE